MKWRLLTGAVLVAALGWAGWWYVGSTAQEAAIRGWLAERRDEGWRAEAAAVDTAGFPNRFDTRIAELRLANPEAGWAWSAPFLDILMLSYRPNQAVAAFPPEQDFAAPGARLTLATELMRASVRLEAGTALALERVSAEIEDARLLGEGWTASVDALEAHLREAEPQPEPAAEYDLYLGLEGLRPPGEALEAAGLGALPGLVEQVVIDGRVALDRPLDRFALEDRPPAIRAISLSAAEAEWGRLSLQVSGAVEADAAGLAEGELEIRARNWREMLRAAVEVGALEEEMAGLIETGLSIVAGFGGDREVVEAPLSFSGGRTWIGPIPVGAAPRLAPPEPR